MTELNAIDPETVKEAKLPRRDWVLLPLLSLITLILLAAFSDFVAGWWFPSSEDGLARCFVKGDVTGNAPAIPNSICSEKNAESAFLAEYRFNSCGYRAGTGCGRKPLNSYRIVVIGSSMAMGLYVPREMSFAALLPEELSKQTGRKIEVYNEAKGGKFRGGPFPARDSPEHFNEVLAADPDAILWIVTPMDIENMSFEDPSPALQAAVQRVPTTGAQGSRLVVGWKKLTVAVANGSVLAKLHYRWEQSKSGLVLKHLLYENEGQDRYVRAYLKNEDDAGFLRTEPSGKWQSLLETFQRYAANFEGQAKAAGVPFAAVLVPNRAQAAMISMGGWPAGYDPYKLDDEIRAIIVNHGGAYVDILPEFRNIPDPEQYYFPVDGHLDAWGHKMIAELLAKQLTGGAVPAFRVIAQPDISLERGR